LRPIRFVPMMALIAATFVVSSAANADVIGSIWENMPDAAGNATIANVPVTPPNVTFTSPTPLNFASTVGGDPAALYTIGGFLGSGGATILTGAGLAGDTLDNTIFNITGTVTVTNGQTFAVAHDDGLTLAVGALTVIDVPGPTSPVVTTVTYTGPSGNLPFELVYGEVLGPPATLQISLPLVSPPPVSQPPSSQPPSSQPPVSQIPEPMTLALLGAGVIGLGVVRRGRS
jgi:PEP-CTERM motif